MPTLTTNNGRLANQIFRNMATSFIAEKHDLLVEYSSYELIQSLGIELFVGKHDYPNTLTLTDDNFFDIYETSDLQTNLNPNLNYFQTTQISKWIYQHLYDNKDKIMAVNPYGERYNNNNDVLIHIRLTDVAHLNPGISYYLKAISGISFDRLFITTDEPDHSIIRELQTIYPDTILLTYDPIHTIQFASTCKHVILSHGSFSAIIGYLSFYSNIFYSEYDKDTRWYGDMFSIPGWNQIDKGA